MKNWSKFFKTKGFREKTLSQKSLYWITLSFLKSKLISVEKKKKLLKKILKLHWMCQKYAHHKKEALQNSELKGKIQEKLPQFKKALTTLLS